jgi:hypothetical protein
MFKRILFVLTLFMVVNASAGEINLNIYGLSYHLNKDEAYHNAPRSVFNSDGQYVYNPGVGIEYDFRNKGEMGWSVFTTLSWFQDCADYAFYYAGAGVRYKNYIFGHWFWEANLAGAVANAEDWDVINGQAVGYGRETTFLPVASLGFGYQFENKQFIKYEATFVPENDNIGGTSGTSLIFMWLTYGF